MTKFRKTRKIENKTQGKKELISIRITTDLLDKLRKESGITGYTQVYIVEDALKLYFSDTEDERMAEVNRRLDNLDKKLSSLNGNIKDILSLKAEKEAAESRESLSRSERCVSKNKEEQGKKKPTIKKQLLIGLEKIGVVELKK